MVANGAVWGVILLSQWRDGVIRIHSKQLNFGVSEVCLAYMQGYEREDYCCSQREVIYRRKKMMIAMQRRESYVLIIEGGNNRLIHDTN